MDKSLFIEQKMKLAAEYESSEKYLHAIQIYQAVIETDPGYSEAVIKTAGLFRKTGNSEAAIGSLKNFLADNPENRETRFYLAEFLMDDKRWDDAIEVLGSLSHNDEPVASFFTGYAYFMLEEYENALIYLNNFISYNPHSDLRFEAYFLVGKIEIEKKNYQGALAVLKKAEPVMGNLWEYNYLSALSYYNIGMYAHALSFAERSINLNREESSLYSLAGRIYLKLGDFLKAEKNLQKFLDIKGDITSDTLALMAEACFNNGKITEAMEYFDKSLTMDPANKLALDGKRNAAGILNERSRASDV